MQSLDPLFARLSRSKFRSRFRLGVKERQYCLEKGAPVIEQHAADFVAKRLAPALPANDGKQTPMRGHPVFIAQHATATCCRGCLAKWHNIPQGEADWFSEQFSTGVLIVPCMLTLAIPGVLPRFKAEQMMPAIALIVSVIASVVIGGAGSLAFPLPALIWCAVRYTPQVTCLLTFVTGAVEVVLVANSVIDISVGSPFSIPQMFSARLGIATMAICPIMVSFSVAAINSLMKQVALRADFDFLTQVYSRSGLYEALKSPSLKQTQHLTVMLLDIDYFKSINDNYGHECGDKVLSVFAQHIQKIVGDKGLVARMGGEEFAVAVPSVNPVDGLLMAEKIRKGVELQPFTWQQKTLYLTVSIGVGSGCASYRTLTDDFNKLMVEADTCLYRSKKDGRNRTSTMRYGEEVV